MAKPKVCYRSLSIQEVRQSPLSHVGGTPNVVVAKFPCIGDECSLFVNDTDEHGNAKPGVGLCGDTVRAIALVRQAAIMEATYAEDHEEEDPPAEPGKGN